MMQILDESWKNWVDTNLNNNCDKLMMYKDMINAGFDHDLITAELKLEDAQVSDIQNEINNQHFVADNSHSGQAKKSDIYIPGSVTVYHPDANLIVLQDFLSDEECLDLQMLIRADQFEHHEEVVRDTDKRLCDLLGVDQAYSTDIETIQLFPAGGGLDILAGKEECSLLALVCLNEPLSGGEVVFPKADLDIPARKGCLIVWEQTRVENLKNILLSINKIAQGFQSLLIKRFYRHSEALIKTPNEYAPAFTKKGFLKTKIPQALYVKILAFYYGNIDVTDDEPDKVFIKGKNEQVSSEIITLPDELKEQIHQTLQPIAESWAGQELEATFVFGIRRYLDTAVLKNHRDREKTHAISVILNIEQTVRNPWALYIEDHTYRGHEVFLQPGDMVLYEGSKLTHGRPKPFEGDAFCNIFVHFQLKK
jgi:prolyl 4-hydroxylase